jgi:hypothetical protein
MKYKLVYKYLFRSEPRDPISSSLLSPFTHQDFLPFSIVIEGKLFHSSKSLHTAILGAVANVDVVLAAVLIVVLTGHNELFRSLGGIFVILWPVGSLAF